VFAVCHCPGYDLLHGEGRQVAEIPHPTFTVQQSREGIAAGQATQTEGEGLIEIQPFLVPVVVPIAVFADCENSRSICPVATS